MELDVRNVQMQLAVFGVDTDDQKDYRLLNFALEKSKQRAMNFCNRDDIPKEMVPEVISMAAGEFMYFRKTFLGVDGLGNLGSHFNNPYRVTQLTEGDTSFSIGDNDNDYINLDLYINNMRMGDRFILEHFRRLDWGSR